MDIVTLGAALNGSAEYVNSHFKGGSNIQIVDNPDGTQTINASGEVSSEDTVARAEIAAIKDGETLDSFGDVETALGDKADTSTTYTKTEIDTALSAKANSADVYSKTAVDTALSNKADKSTTYTKTEVDTSLSNKADKSTTYTKTEVDTALGGKVDKETGKGLSTNDYTTAEKAKLAGIEAQANKTTVDDALSGSSTNPVQNKVVKSALDSKANASTTYTKTEVDTALDGKADTSDIPTVPITAIQKNGTGITPISGTVNITVPTSAADVSALPNTTKYAAALSLTINSSTFVMTGQLKDQNGDNLGTAQTIDLPLESVVVGGSYNSQTKKVVLTLQNGNTIEFSVADLVSGLQTELSASNKLNPAYINYDSTHRAVSDTEKSTWNGKQSALTTEQLAAVNSGITSEDVEQISTNKNNILSIKQVPTVGSGDNGKVLTAGTNGEYSWATFDKDFIEGFLYNDNFYSDYSHTTEITGDFDKIYLDLHTDNIYYFDDSGTGDKYHYIGLEPYESKTAAQGGTDVSLCTTGEKYTWNNKSTLQLTNSTTPIVDGTAAIGTSTYAAKADHVHPTDTSRQAAITAQSPLSADVVSDTNTTHKFATQTQLDQISTNANNISKLTPIDGDITWNTSAIGSEPSINTKYIMQQGNIVNIQLYIEFATALTENTETVIGTLTGVIFPKNIYRGVAMQGADYYSSVFTPCYIAIGTTGNVIIKPPTGATNKKYLINITYHNQ